MLYADKPAHYLQELDSASLPRSNLLFISDSFSRIGIFP